MFSTSAVGLCNLGTTSWALQNVEISLDKFCQTKWCTEALCIYGYGSTWMHSFRNTGDYVYVFVYSTSSFFGKKKEEAFYKIIGL